MEINGKEIALDLYAGLKENVINLKDKGIIPTLYVLLVGENPSSVAYVNQKRKWAEFIGAKVIIEKFSVATEAFLEERINELNADTSVHAILIQIPLPPHLNAQKLTELVTTQKDIDGFHPDSPFTPPLAAAVVTVLTEIMKREGEEDNIFTWLQSKKIVLIGKGKAGGKPVHNLFERKNISHMIIDSKTEKKEALMKDADIIISAVGKKRVVTSEMIKPGVILIGVGMNLDENIKLFGDYDISDIRAKANYFTPTPGGVGPVNVACLLKNLIEAAKR
jgi:methylenetetrahydrofolate dehydrogenase (NADP+)/methenyltetrahydrofolate cyclohydrolase